MDNSSIGKLIRQKKEDKKALAADMGFNAKMPLLAIILDKELDNAEEKLLEEFLKSLEVLEIEAVVLADSNLDSISFPHTIIITYSQKNRKKLLSAADMAIVFDFNDVEEMLLNGTIPVSLKREELKNYDPRYENGNSFVYNKKNTWGIFEALVRALETYKLPYDWQSIIRGGIEGVK